MLESLKDILGYIKQAQDQRERLIRQGVRAFVQRERIIELLEQIAKIETAAGDIASFAGSVDQPTKQLEEIRIMAPKSFALAAVAQTMLDDQMALVHWQPLEADGVTPGAIPTGSAAPVTSASPGTAVTVDNTVDPTGLSANVKGIKGQKGDEVISVSFVNADGTTARGQVTITITPDPAELDVSSFGATVDSPIPQTAPVAASGLGSGTQQAQRSGNRDLDPGQQAQRNPFSTGTTGKV